LLGVGQSAVLWQTMQPAIGVPAQTPLVQTSFSVHGLLSLQSVPLPLLVTPQTLFTHVACWHGLGGVGQSATL
jgi:hypothetical protein